MHARISTRPTRIAELIPLSPQALGYHDASGSQGYGGVWFPTPDLMTREGTVQNTPPLWRLPWPQDLIYMLISDENPRGTVTSTEFELAGRLLQLDTLAHCYDIREQTVVIKTDNLNTIFWERKGSCTTDKILQDCSPAARAGLSSDFSLAQKYVQCGVSLCRSNSTGTHWGQWVQYCNQLDLNPLLENIEKKIPILQVFLHQVLSGPCVADKHEVKSRTAEEYLRSVAQTYLSLGVNDPRMRDGEYTATKYDSTPFEFKDVQLWQGRIRPNLLHAMDDELLAASFSALPFDCQKNATRGETIGHSQSGDPDMCPVRYIARRIIHLRLHNSLPSTPLATSYNSNGSTFNLKPANITTSLKQAVNFLDPTLITILTCRRGKCIVMWWSGHGFYLALRPMKI